MGKAGGRFDPDNIRYRKQSLCPNIPTKEISHASASANGARPDQTGQTRDNH